jgi:hypothetical protein
MDIPDFRRLDHLIFLFPGVLGQEFLNNLVIDAEQYLFHGQGEE